MRYKKSPFIELPEYPVPQIKLIYKPEFNFDSRPFVGNTVLAGLFLQHTWDRDTVEMQERFTVLLLSKSKKLLGVYESSVGGISATQVDSRLVFSASLLANASSIIIAHNHPSGTLEPSEADELFTKMMVKQGKLLKIDVVDSVIVTKNGYFSFAAANLIK